MTGLRHSWHIHRSLSYTWMRLTGATKALRRWARSLSFAMRRPHRGEQLWCFGLSVTNHVRHMGQRTLYQHRLAGLRTVMSGTRRDCRLALHSTTWECAACLASYQQRVEQYFALGLVTVPCRPQCAHAISMVRGVAGYRLA